MPALITYTDGAGLMNTSMSSKGGFGAAAFGGAGLGAAGAAGYGMSTMNGGTQFYNQMEMTSMDHGMSGHLGMMTDDFSTYDRAMALDDDYLYHYYSTVSGDILQSTQKRHHPDYGHEPQT